MAQQGQQGRDRPTTQRILLVVALALLALLLCGIISGWLLRCRGPIVPTPTPTATPAWPGVVATMTQQPPAPTAAPTATATPTASGAPLTPALGTPGASPTRRHTPAATRRPATATPGTPATAAPITPATATATRRPATQTPTPTRTSTPYGGLYILLEGEPVQAVNAAPGVALPVQELVFRNQATSTVAAKYRLRAALVAGSSAFYEGINVHACRQASDGTWPCYYDGALRDMLLTPDAGRPGSTPGMVVSPGEAQQWRFTYTPDTGLGNWAQGASCTFSIVAEATEAGNPGWLP